MVSPRCFLKRLGFLVPVWLLLGPASAHSQIPFFCHEFCCPKTKFCVPKPPCLKYCCKCPKPVCDPHELENYGYYPTCGVPGCNRSTGRTARCRRQPSWPLITIRAKSSVNSHPTSN